MTHPQGLKLRSPRPDDLAPIVQIENACFRDPWPPESLLSELRTDSMRQGLVAEANDEVLGYIMAWRVADEIHIINIAVRPGYRRSGIGRYLLQATLDAARAGKQRIATLEVRRSNADARRFYESFGFTQQGVREKYYSDNDEDALILALDL